MDQLTGLWKMWTHCARFFPNWPVIWNWPYLLLSKKHSKNQISSTPRRRKNQTSFLSVFCIGVVTIIIYDKKLDSRFVLKGKRKFVIVDYQWNLTNWYRVLKLLLHCKNYWFGFNRKQASKKNRIVQCMFITLNRVVGRKTGWSPDYLINVAGKGDNMNET